MCLVAQATAATANIIKCPAGRCGDGPVLVVSVGPNGTATVVVIVAIAQIGSTGPVWTAAGYATPGGWQVAGVPVPLYVGAVTQGWNTTIPLRGGICPLVTSAAGPPGRYGLFVSSAQVDDSGFRDVHATIAQMRASGDESLIAAADEAARDLAKIPSGALWMQSLDALRNNMSSVTSQVCE